jgi:membrane protein
MHPKTVKQFSMRNALSQAYGDLRTKHTMLMAAALSYYFVLSLFPALIFLSASLAYLPVPDLFGHALGLISRFLPPDSMRLVRKVLADVITPERRTFLSFGFFGTLWAMSGGFSAIIEALNVEYEVRDDPRPFWKKRLLALGLALVIGALLLVALALMIVGPKFGEWLSGKVRLSAMFVSLWPYIDWSIAVVFAVLAVEALFFLAPNVKQRFLATLPGAALAVGCWMTLSCLLGVYFRHFAHFNKSYGVLGAAIALMVWLYWTGFAILAGAELNSELAKHSLQGSIEQRNESHHTARVDAAA